MLVPETHAFALLPKQQKYLPPPNVLFVKACVVSKYINKFLEIKKKKSIMTEFD